MGPLSRIGRSCSLRITVSALNGNYHFASRLQINIPQVDSVRDLLCIYSNVKFARPFSAQRQRQNSLQHASKQTPREITLRQQQPAVDCMLYQLPAVFY